MTVPRLYLSVNGCLFPDAEPDPEWGDVAQASILINRGPGPRASYNVQWAPRLITDLDSLLMEFGVELVWLTDWNELDAARQLLVPELGGLAGGRMLDAAAPPTRPGAAGSASAGESSGLWKSQRIEEDQGMPAPFIWIDDAEVERHGERVRGATAETPSLLIPAYSAVGITVDDLALMRTWLKHLA